MLYYIVYFILIFLIAFSISLFCLLKKEYVKERLYLIVPAICIGLWAILALLIEDYSTPFTWDFGIFYESGLQVFNDPAHLYDINGFLYTPSFAIWFALSFSLLPFQIAAYAFFIVSYIFAVLTLIEYDKILRLMNVNQKSHRFIFLLIISNGFFVLYQFKFNQSKYLLFLILVFIIRRELQFNNEQKEKDLKYYLINYALLVFAIGGAPYFVFFLIIYLFQDIPPKAIFKKDHVKKYLICLVMFIIQNFLFILYPQQILDFLDGFNHPQRRNEKLKLIYLREFMDVSSRVMLFLSVIFTIVLFVITITLIYKSTIKIEEKFAYFSIAYVLIGIFAYTLLLSLLLFSFILLLFVPFLNQNYRGIEFIKNNKYLLIGLLSITGIFFAAIDFIMYEYLSILQEYPYIIFFYARWIVLLCIMMSSLILVRIRYKKLN